MPFHAVIGQFKPRKADYGRNLERVGEVFAQVSSMEPTPDVLVLPETALSGYFLEGGVREVARSAEEVFADLQRVYREQGGKPGSVLDVVTGFYELHEGKYYNAALYATLTGSDDTPAKAGLKHVHRKFFLPTYGVFDEKRFVARGRSIQAFNTRLGRAAILICEDVWHSVASMLAALQGAQVVYVLSASPGRGFGGEQVGNLERWKLLLPGVAAEHSVFVVYAGLVGFEGGKGFTGSSSVVDPWGRVRVTGSVTEECLVRDTIDLDDVAIARAGSPLLSDLEEALPAVLLEMEAIARRPHVR